MEGLSPEQYQRRVAALEKNIEEEAAREREKTGNEVLGAEAVMSRDPHHRPENMDRSPAPRFHTATESAWRLLYEAYSEFLAAFRTAAAKFRDAFSLHTWQRAHIGSAPHPSLKGKPQLY